MGTRYLIHSDLHLGHFACMGFEPERTSFEDIIKDVKHQTHDKDIIINLGDIGFKDADYWMKEYRQACKGKIILVKGNHDRNKTYTYFYKHKFDFVCERFSLNIYGYHILFSHLPVRVPDDCIGIFGHLHRFNHTIEEFNQLYPFLGTEYKIFDGFVLFKNYILITTDNNCKLQNLQKVIDKYRSAWHDNCKPVTL
jgi:calcineurin-like phosphoesterase family protein